jgi:predicted DNA-binding transcriptional regulator AlpA
MAMQVAQKALENFEVMPDVAKVRLPLVALLYGCSTATVWRRVRSGHIPAPQRMGLRTTVWTVGSLRAHLAGATK